VFGKRSGTDTDFRAPKPGAVLPEPSQAPAATVSRAPLPPAVASPSLAPAKAPPPPAMESRRSDN